MPAKVARISKTPNSAETMPQRINYPRPRAYEFLMEAAPVGSVLSRIHRDLDTQYHCKGFMLSETLRRMLLRV